MGAHQAEPELRSSARADRPAITVLAEVLGAQVQAAADATDAGRDTD